MISDRFYVYIDSKKRLAGSDSSFKYEIKYPPGMTYKYVCVLRVSIPKTYYIINKPHNYFILREVKDGVQSESRIEVPIGNIGRSKFVEHMIHYLNVNSSYHWTYNITYASYDDFDDGKFGFTVEGKDEKDSAALVFHDGLYEQFGFDRNSVNEFDNDGFLESSGVVKFQAEDILYLHSDLVQKAKRSILQDVYAANTPTSSNIVWECHSLECNSKELNGNNEGPMFSLTDENFMPIDLNKGNMCITLLFYNQGTPFPGTPRL